jgi:beta-glucanase (GH16 family)
VSDRRPLRTGSAVAALAGIAVLLTACGGNLLPPERPADALDEQSWGFESAFLGSGDGSVHVYSPEAVTVADGLLRITATRLDEPMQVDDDSDGTVDRILTWQSGFVTTRERVEFTHGRFEVRARVPAGAGLWPAVWLRPLGRAYGSWPRSGEIDIVEILGDDIGRAHTTAHWWDGEHVLDAVASEITNIGDGFHLFALEWSPDELVWSIDGVVVHRLTDWHTDLGPSGAPFDQAFHLNVNLAVGGGWPGPPDDDTPDGATFEVDWVRVTELPGG